MKEFDTLLTDFYRCKIEDTGETIHRLVEFKLPIDVTEMLQYTNEREIAIKFPEQELVRFLNDLETFLMLIGTLQKHKHLESEYHKLLIMAKLLE